MADNFCPTCHSRIHTDPVPKANRKRGSLTPGTDQPLPEVILSASEEVVPMWTDDPCLNIEGFNGEDYIGVQKVSGVWLKELQEVRHNEEVEVGISESLQTQFTETVGQHLKAIHINELRESVEKILNASGLTLSEYFSIDANGDAIEQGPNDLEDKDEWTDVSRGLPYRRLDGTLSGEFILPDGTTAQSPTIPRLTHFRVINVEDLRHPIQLGWREFWSISPINLFFNSDINFFTQTITPIGATTQTRNRILEADAIANNFGISPTDGGNTYIEDADKLWLILADTIKRIRSHNVEFVFTVSCLGSFTVKDAGQIFDANALTTINVVDTSDVDILNAKSEAKILEINTHKYVTHSPSTSNWQAGQADYDLNVRHYWDNNVAYSNRNIKINFKTNFKFYLKATSTGMRSNYRITPTSKLVTFCDNSIQNINAYAETTSGNALSYYASQLLSSINIDNYFTYNNISKDIILLKNGDTEVVVRLFFDVDPDSSDFVTIQAPLNGQTFKLFKPTDETEVNTILVALTSREEYDVTININDLFSAWQQMETEDSQLVSDFFSYTSHAVLNDENIKVQNSNGTLVTFVSSDLRLSGQALGVVGGDIFSGNDSFSVDKNSAIAYLTRQRTWTDHDEMAKVEYTAIRIENNDNTVRT